MRSMAFADSSSVWHSVCAVKVAVRGKSGLDAPAMKSALATRTTSARCTASDRRVGGLS